MSEESMIERLRARPWRLMLFVQPPDGPRYAVCMDACASHADAVSALVRHPGTWVESAPEFVEVT